MTPQERFKELFLNNIVDAWYKHVAEGRPIDETCVMSWAAKEVAEVVCAREKTENKCPLSGRMGQCASGECFHQKTEEPKRWRAENGETYFCLNTNLSVWEAAEHESVPDDNRWSTGNYFKTKAQAEEAAKKIKALLLSL